MYFKETGRHTEIELNDNEMENMQGGKSVRVSI